MEKRYWLCTFFNCTRFCCIFLSNWKQIHYTMTQMLENERNYFIFFMVDKVVSKTSFVCFRTFLQLLKDPIAYSDLIYSFHSVFLQIPIFHDLLFHDPGQSNWKGLLVIFLWPIFFNNIMYSIYFVLLLLKSEFNEKVNPFLPSFPFWLSKRSKWNIEKKCVKSIKRTTVQKYSTE